MALASLLQQCKGMFEFTSSQIYGWQEAATPSSLGLVPLLEKFPWKEEFPKSSTGQTPGTNRNWDSTEMPGTLRWETLIRPQKQLIQ